MALVSSLSFLALALLGPASLATAKPYLKEINNTAWEFGNDDWRAVQVGDTVRELYYQDRELVGNARGHHWSSSDERNHFVVTDAVITAEGTYEGLDFLDFYFDCQAGEQHWVIFEGLHGSYQYFIHKDLPPTEEFRSLWRLDNRTFTHGWTKSKDDPLPPLSWHVKSEEIFDATFPHPEKPGSWITKYDFAEFIQNLDYYGVYGEDIGSWYVVPGKDYYNGDHSRQELTVHREATTGDAVLLNMIHGSHFYRKANRKVAEAKMWGPWLWYLNDGSVDDVAQRFQEERALWPYPWLQDVAYHSRGVVKGQLVLSDGRPAANAAVFLGDNNPDLEPTRQSQGYYYVGYADLEGRFQLDNVREGVYNLQAWSNGSTIADVSSRYAHNNVEVSRDGTADLETLEWELPKGEEIFRVGDFDHTTYGFKVGGEPRAYGLADLCPADLIYTIGESEVRDWCYAQTKLGNWTISFPPVESHSQTPDATLIVSVAGYSTNASSYIYANGQKIGNFTANPDVNGVGNMINDGCLYRSCTISGDSRSLEFPFDVSVLNTVESQGDQQVEKNEITFHLYDNRGNESELNTTQRGVMFDAIALRW